MTNETERAGLIDALAEEIRRVDGRHSLGAGQMAEALLPWVESHLLADAEDLPDDLDTATLVLRSKLIEHAVYLSPHTCRQIAAAITTPQPAPVDAAVERDAPDPTLLKFYQVDDYPALVAEMEGHILKLIDTHKRNVKPWEDTFPPTLLPKWIREQEQRALVLADSWQDEAAESWGESREHATLQRCADELRAALTAQQQESGS